MTANLQDLSHQDLRHMLGNRAMNAGVFAIDAAPQDVQTGATINYTIKGVFYSKAAVAAIDVSTLTGLPTDALATGYTQIFGMELNAAGTISVVYGDQRLTSDVTAGNVKLDWPKASDDDHTVFAAVKVANASGADFVFGTTSLAAAGVTDTYYDLAVSGF